MRGQGDVHEPQGKGMMICPYFESVAIINRKMYSREENNSK